MKHFKTRKQLDGMVKAVRDEAMAEAEKTGLPLIRSRGTWLCTANEEQEQCPPLPESEENVWDRTVQQIDQLIFRVEQDYPDVNCIYIAGGYNGATSPYAYHEHGDYEPLISQWFVEIWKRDQEVIQ